MPTKICPVCGKEFGLGIRPSHLAQRTYCSFECRNYAINPERELGLAPKTCQHCGKEFKPKTHSIKAAAKQLFCSATCRNKARATTLLVPCPQCGELFKPVSRGRDGRKKFCSKRCADNSRIGKPIQWLLRPRPRAATSLNYVKQVIIEMYPSHGADRLAEMLGISRVFILNFANRQHVTLNEETRHKIVHSAAKAYMSDNNPMKCADVRAKVQKWWDDHPEQAAKLRAALVTGHQKLQRDKPSSLELRLRGYLDGLGVCYEPSALIKSKFIVDVRIGMLILEADGDWWHGHPRFEPLNERQVQQRKRDASRNKYLEACGYTVVRIWESDMSKDLVIAILKEHGVIAG